MVEQGTHKPLVGSSTLPPGTSFLWLGLRFEVEERTLLRFDNGSGPGDLLNTGVATRTRPGAVLEP